MKSAVAEQSSSPDDPASPDLDSDTTASSPTVLFHDMDQDGDLDIVVNNGSGEAYWIENELGREAEGLFGHEAFSYITPTAMAVGDVDGDQVPDVVVGHISGAKVFFNNGEWTSKNLGIVLQNPRAISVEDLDGDGDNDIVIRDSRELTVVQNIRSDIGFQSMAWPDLGDHSFLGIVSIAGPAQNKGVLTMDVHKGMLGLVHYDGQGWQPFMPLEARKDGLELFESMQANDLDGVVLRDQHDNEVRVEFTETGELVLNSLAEPVADEPVIGDTGEMPAVEGDDAADSHGMFESALFPMFNKSPGPSESIQSLDFMFRAEPVTSVDYSGNGKGVIVDLAEGEGSDASKYWLIPGSGESWTIAGTVTDVVGSEYSDTLYGNDSDNALEGLAGKDILLGRDGDDDLRGNEGNDVLYGGDGDDTLYGGKHSDVLFGDGGQDFLDGGMGDDYLFAGDGDDQLRGSEGNDVLFGNGGNDGLQGGCGTDVLYGGSGADSLFGGCGGDILMGNGGHDWLQGGEGMDILLGGSGQDTFFYADASEGGDTIYDFLRGEDVFEFGFGSHALYTVSATYTGSLGQAGDGFVWEDAGNGFGTLYYDPDLNHSGDETLIAQVDMEDGSSLTLDDISVV